MEKIDLSAEQLQKLARMEIYQVPRKQTAITFGVSEDILLQIISSEEYKVEEQKIATEKFEEDELINQGWDGVESLGLTRVVTALQNNPDPDFALRAAMVANKAIRRGGFKNNPINLDQNSIVATLNMNIKYIDKIQQNFSIEVNNEKPKLERKKSSDFMGAKEVQKILSQPVKDENLSNEEKMALESLETLKFDQ